MRTIQTVAEITQDGLLKVQAQAPANLEPGQWQAVVVVDEITSGPTRGTSAPSTSSHLELCDELRKRWPKDLSTAKLLDEIRR